MICTPKPRKCRKHNTDYYAVNLKRIGQGERFFPTTTEGYKAARDLCAKVASEQEAFGQAAWELPLASRMDAIQALAILKPSGLSLVDAAKMVLAAKGTQKKIPPTFAFFAVSLFLQSRDYRASTHKRNRIILLRVFKDNGALSEYTPEYLDNLLRNTLGLKDNTLRTYWGVLQTFFGWAERKGYVQKNPVAAMEKPPRVARDIEILTVDQVIQLMDAAERLSPNCLMPSLALRLFGGIRLSELLALTCADVDLRRGQVLISGKVSKTKKARFVPVLPAMLSYIDDFVSFNADAKVFCWEEKMWAAVQEQAGFTVPRNALRKTFISNHVVHFGSLDRTCQIAGHTPQVSVEHYMALVHPDDAKAFFDLRRIMP